MKTKKIFLSHVWNDRVFACRVGYHLKRCGAEVFTFVEHQGTTSFVTAINAHWSASDAVVFLVGQRIGNGMDYELKRVQEEQMTHKVYRATKVRLPDAATSPELEAIMGADLEVKSCNEGEAMKIAKDIAGRFEIRWISDDDLPSNPHLFDYEKDIIKFYRLRAMSHGMTGSAEYGDPDEAAREQWAKDIKNQLLGGCPPEWPQVEVLHPRVSILDSDPEGGIEKEIEDQIGTFRDDSNYVSISSLVRTTDLGDTLPRDDLMFPEAGPRRDWCFPRRGNNLNVAIVVSGGIAPGINALIDGIVQRHELYARLARHKVTIYGLRNGFLAFEQGNDPFDTKLVGGNHSANENNVLHTANSTHTGGSIIGTSRAELWLDDDERQIQLNKADGRLANKQIDILYVIGGDGSMKAAHALWSTARKNPGRLPLSVVGVPKTMDNDILWVWQSFGFMSAVEKARETIETLATEVTSNPRIGVVQLFGSDSGFIVSHAVLASASGQCVLALIPEVDFSMKHIVSYLFCQLTAAGEKLPHCLIVMAETAIPTDAMDFIKKHRRKLGLSRDEHKAIKKYCSDRENKRRIQGQTNDHLRTAGLKIVSRGIEIELKENHQSVQVLKEHLQAIGKREVELRNASGHVQWERLRMLTNEPRHLVRAIPPSCQDIIMCQRLGALAVDNAIAGYTDFMISQWVTEYVLVPLRLVTLGRKHVHKDGIFWKSVLAKTGQPAKLSD